MDRQGLRLRAQLTHSHCLIEYCFNLGGIFRADPDEHMVCIACLPSRSNDGAVQSVAMGVGR